LCAGRPEQRVSGPSAINSWIRVRRQLSRKQLPQPELYQSLLLNTYLSLQVTPHPPTRSFRALSRSPVWVSPSKQCPVHTHNIFQEHTLASMPKAQRATRPTALDFSPVDYKKPGRSNIAPLISPKMTPLSLRIIANAATATNGPMPNMQNGPRSSPGPQSQGQMPPVPNGKPTSPSPYNERQNPMSPTQQIASQTVSSKDPKAAAQAASDMRNVVRRKLTGYVGFANLPNQWHRKSVRKGFNFNVMVVGKQFSSKETQWVVLILYR